MFAIAFTIFAVMGWLTLPLGPIWPAFPYIHQVGTVPLTDNGLLTAEFRSARISVFLQFIVRPNEDAASAKLSMESCNASSESAISAQSSAY